MGGAKEKGGESVKAAARCFEGGRQGCWEKGGGRGEGGRNGALPTPAVASARAKQGPARRAREGGSVCVRRARRRRPAEAREEGRGGWECGEGAAARLGQGARRGAPLIGECLAREQKRASGRESLPSPGRWRRSWSAGAGAGRRGGASRSEWWSGGQACQPGCRHGCREAGSGSRPPPSPAAEVEPLPRRPLQLHHSRKKENRVTEHRSQKRA